MSLEETLKQIQRDLADIKREIGAIPKLNDAIEKLWDLPKRMTVLEEDVLGMADDIDELKEKVNKCMEKTSDLEQYSRKYNLIISGIPVLRNENLRSIVIDMADSLGIKVYYNDIDTIHRLSERDGKRAIIARFISRDLKYEIVRASKIQKLTDAFLRLQSGKDPAPVFCDEHLTPESKFMLLKAKRMKKAKLLEYVWTKDCTVKVKVNKGGDTIIVSKPEQLDSLEQSLKQGMVLTNNQRAAQTNDSVSNQAEPVDTINVHLSGKERNKRSLEDRSPESNAEPNAVSLQTSNADSYQGRSTGRKALKQTKLYATSIGSSNGGKTNQNHANGQQSSDATVSEYVEN